MKIAVVGCAHGELDQIYDSVNRIQQNEKIDLIICCGDFQATRNECDLRCMAIPEKFYNIGSFYKYYSGEKEAPVLTIFIGGNHEASNFLQELPYGGWVAPKIYYMGYAGVIKVGNLRIGGLSGIFKPFDYMKGHFERAPYNKDSLRSVYHVRNIEVFRLRQVSGNLDVMLSHDWPRGVYNFGAVDELLRNKPFFKAEVEENKLGSEPCADLLFHLKPKYWFSAHLHTRFSALIPHSGNQESEEKIQENCTTSFLALDKCLPKRKYLEIVEVPTDVDNSEPELYYDLEWLTILHLTDHLMSSKKSMTYMPSKSSSERWQFTPTDEEKDFIFRKMNHDLKIPQNFEKTACSYEYAHSRGPRRFIQSPKAVPNPQTETFCNRLGIKDPIGNFENVNSSSYIRSPYNKSPFSTPEKAEFSTFLSSNDSLQENSAASISSENTDSAEMNSVNYSKNEHSFPNSANDSFTSADYFSFIDRSSLSNRPASTPDVLKKRKYDFPSFKEQDSESSTSATNMLPIEIDRTGNTSLIKRRNANIYQDQE